MLQKKKEKGSRQRTQLAVAECVCVDDEIFATSSYRRGDAEANQRAPKKA